MRPAPTRLPLLQCTKAGRVPASSRTASSSRLNVASLTAPCPTGMWRYSSPAWTTASGVLKGRGSIASRRSITTVHPARFSAARCSGAGCPPVTIPWIGSQALGMPAMASSRWLIGVAAASIGRSIYSQADRHGVAPPSVAPRPLEAASQAVAQFGRGVPDGAALPALPRGGRPHGHDPGGRSRGRVELPYLPEPHPCDGARARCQGACHHARRLAPRRPPPHRRIPTAPAAVRAVAAGSDAAEGRGISEDPAPKGSRLPIGPAGRDVVAPAPTLRPPAPRPRRPAP